ncbi:DUF2973 domain-containing protein [Aliterella atlantica]|uniref:DUF2973 domain-containing protein n=1 Tax=Aliterella atlantica CENA595 TaxID=1618023 RepID=A0A0D8ZPT1_9CYAN|nr:DUF2973 domain-containing protein [Aliterella atlantica]KJH70524.1 hypothetical protein UH38_17280 [Aliterella atlantica CENA595]
MLQLLYILAFTILALIAVSNLIRNLIMFSFERDRVYPSGTMTARTVPHPELLDSTGRIIKDPLLVMRSIDVEDAREQLNALYEASPNYNSEVDKEI